MISLARNMVTNPTCLATLTNNINLGTWATDDYYFDEKHNPHILEACSISSNDNADTPSVDTASCGWFQVLFWKAKYDKYVTLIQEFD
jgi:hypothetical protein